MTDLDAFAASRYLSLETTRRDGTPVRTPVWSAVDGDRLLVRSFAKTGKVKRLRREPRVRVAPCDRAGRTPEGAWAQGRARVLEGDEARRADRRLTARQGWSKRLTDLAYRPRLGPKVVVEVLLATPAGRR